MCKKSCVSIVRLAWSIFFEAVLFSPVSLFSPKNRRAMRPMYSRAISRVPNWYACSSVGVSRTKSSSLGGLSGSGNIRLTISRSSLVPKALKRAPSGIGVLSDMYGITALSAGFDLPLFFFFGNPITTVVLRPDRPPDTLLTSAK